MKKYTFKTEPFDHQRKALTDSWAAEYYALFMEMGTGKSKVAIDTIGILHMMDKINAALIVAPKGVYDNWVKGEIPSHLPDEHRAAGHAVDAVSYQEVSGHEIRDFMFGEERHLRIFVMNVEALSTPRGTKAALTFLAEIP